MYDFGDREDFGEAVADYSDFGDVVLGVGSVDFGLVQ